MPEEVVRYAAATEGRGIEVLIAAAGGAAHLAGVTAAQTLLPVLGVPMESASLKGMDSLLSTVKMPAGIPVGTLAIGRPGAVNAALLPAPFSRASTRSTARRSGSTARLSPRAASPKAIPAKRPPAR